MPNRSKRPRHLVLLIAAVTVLPFGMLLWLGWRLVDQDHLLEQQQVRQRVNRAADRAVSALQKQLSAAEQAVMDSRGDPPPGVFVFAFSSPLPEATTAVFSAGEDLELRQRKLPEALAEYQKLSSSRDRAVLANALLRIGRTQQRSGQLDEALTTYTRMATIEDAAIAQVPASLVALYARGRLLVNDARRESELRDTGRELSRGLRSGRWSLTAPIFELYKRCGALER